MEKLTPQEKIYLSSVIEPFRDRVRTISKIECVVEGTKLDFLTIYYNGLLGRTDSLDLPYFRHNKYYKNMEGNIDYTLEELGL